jgi:hypothetical protein
LSSVAATAKHKFQLKTGINVINLFYRAYQLENVISKRFTLFP